MSTLPRDSSNAANVTRVITPAQHEQQVDAAVHKFVLVAAELDIARPSAAELRELCRQVADLSADLFSSEIAIGVRGDPEIPGELHFTFDVAVIGSVDDIVARSNDWHIRLREAIGRQAELFCLSLDMR